VSAVVRRYVAHSCFTSRLAFRQVGLNAKNIHALQYCSKLRFRLLFACPEATGCKKITPSFLARCLTGRLKHTIQRLNNQVEFSCLQRPAVALLTKYSRNFGNVPKITTLVLSTSKSVWPGYPSSKKKLRCGFRRYCVDGHLLQGVSNGGFKGRRARHLPRVPPLLGPPRGVSRINLLHFWCKAYCPLIVSSEADHKHSAFERAPSNNCEV